MEKNRLYYGDNLDVMRRHVAAESVDLVYLDPPFKSNQDYNVLFGEQDGSRAAAQITAFEDTWHWDNSAAVAFEDVIRGGGHPAEALSAFMVLLGPSDMLAYLSMMAPRLIELRRVLKPAGSIYLHCDPAASHYLKLLLDAIFGAANFRSEIIWKRTSAHSSAKRYAPVHDTILYYGRGPAAPKWNGPRTEYDPAYIAKYYRFNDGDGRLYWRNSLTAAGTRNGSSGQPWRGVDVSATGQHWKFTIAHLDELDAKGQIYWPPKGGFPQIKRYLDELKGKAVPDIWDDIDRINPVGNERLGYPTQKPVALLERILKASSNEGDLVLDPFCGCGTAVDAAQRLNRRWVGIDITHLAVNLIRHRLRDAYGPSIVGSYDVVGEPTSIADAQQLAQDDPYQFQWWALGLVGARPVEQKKGADRGIDGTLFFLDEGKPKRVIISVKAGKTGAAHVRDLRGVIERDEAAIGVLISMQAPTAEMRKEAASASFYHPATLEAKDYARIQLLTVADLLAGKDIAYPVSERVTFKKAPKASGAYETGSLLDSDPSS